MRQSLLGANGRDDFAVRVEVHVEEHLVTISDGESQVRNPATGAVAMVLRVAGRLGEFGHGDVRARQVGVAKAKVDDVTAVGARLGLQSIDLGKDVRRQTRNAAELHL